jgi:anhydro-N-acetylmuramic acid kinase
MAGHVTPGNFAIAMGVANSSYVQAPPPKSTDGPQMIQLFEERLAYVTEFAKTSSLETPLRVEDLLAVACLTTAMCVMHGFRRYCSGPAQVLVSGGGVHNQEIMKELRRALNWPTGTTVDPLGDLGVPADAKEALAFALLAAATLDGEPSNVPSVTGAKRAVVLGSITPKP